MLAWLKWPLSLLSMALPSWVLPVSLAAGLLLGLGGAYVKGYRDASQNCREATLKAQLAILKKDIAIQEAADKQEAIALDRMTKKNFELEAKVKVYAETLKPNAGCNLTSDDVKRLYELRR